MCQKFISNCLNFTDIERETQAPRETETGFTAFNMKEEMEEGHFDKEGHYHWKKEKEIRDNWLDEIDWMKVKMNYFQLLYLKYCM